jgi:hypothetical protein
MALGDHTKCFKADLILVFIVQVPPVQGVLPTVQIDS